MLQTTPLDLSVKTNPSPNRIHLFKREIEVQHCVGNIKPSQYLKIKHESEEKFSNKYDLSSAQLSSDVSHTPPCNDKLPHSSGNHNAAVSKRRKTIFTSSQLDRLEREYQQLKYVQLPKKRILAKELNLNENSIKIWYQNRRKKEIRQERLWQRQISLISQPYPTHVPHYDTNIFYSQYFPKTCSSFPSHLPLNPSVSPCLHSNRTNCCTCFPVTDNSTVLFGIFKRA